jgi:hypothetical protein
MHSCPLRNLNRCDTLRYKYTYNAKMFLFDIYETILQLLIYMYLALKCICEYKIDII